MTFNYSINTGKAIIDSADQSYWQRITGSSLTLDGSNLFQNVGSMANAYKNLYGAEFAISDGYKFFENNEMSSILNVSELNYSYTEELSRVDVYKNVFMQKLGYSGVLDNFEPTAEVAATVFKNYSFYLYDFEGAKTTTTTNNLSNIDISNLSNLDTQDQLKSLYKQLEEEANKLKETLYQDELAYGGYPEIEYTEVEAQNELLQQQLNMEMKNFQTLLEDMYNVMKVNAGGHDQDNGNTEDAMRFKEQEAATAATLAGKLVLDYAEKYYNHNVKPQADEYIFAQAFMDDNRVADINTVLDGYLGSYASIPTLKSIQFETTLQTNEIKYDAGQPFSNVDTLVQNESDYELRQQMLSEINSLLKDGLVGIGFSSDNTSQKLEKQKSILEGRIKTYIKAASQKEDGWEATLRGQLSSASINASTINNIVANIKKDADYYTDNSDIETALKTAYKTYKKQSAGDAWKDQLKLDLAKTSLSQGKIAEIIDRDNIEYYYNDNGITNTARTEILQEDVIGNVDNTKSEIKDTIKNAILDYGKNVENVSTWENENDLRNNLVSSGLLTAGEINKIINDIKSYHYSDIEYNANDNSLKNNLKTLLGLGDISDALYNKLKEQIVYTYEAYDQSTDKDNFDFSSLRSTILAVVSGEPNGTSLSNEIKDDSKWGTFTSFFSGYFARDIEKSSTKNFDEIEKMVSLLSVSDNSLENKNMSDLMDMLNTQSSFNRKIMDGVLSTDDEKLLYTNIKTDIKSAMSTDALSNALESDTTTAVTELIDVLVTGKAYPLKGGELKSSETTVVIAAVTDYIGKIKDSHKFGQDIENQLEFLPLKYLNIDKTNWLNSPGASSSTQYVFDLQDDNAEDITSVGDENINTSNIGALKDSQLAEIGDNTTDYITWMVRDFFGVGGITTDIKDTSYCFQEADPIAAKLVQSAENLVKLNMEKQKYNVEAAVNNQIRAEYEARLGAMQAINQILACPVPTSENDPYNVEINGEKYILGKDINDDKVINSIVEIFGIDDTKDNVFQSLKALDDNQDGYVSKEELSAHNIIFNKVDNEGKLTAETFDISKIQGISLSELENADGTNNVFGLFKLDLESSRADGTVTFENDAYFDNLFSKNDVMTSMEEIDVETSQEVMPEVIETEENVFEKKYSFNLGEDNKNIFEKLFDELCWKMGINNISEVQKDKIIDSIDEDLDIDIVEAQMQQKLDTFNLSA